MASAYLPFCVFIHHFYQFRFIFYSDMEANAHGIPPSSVLDQLIVLSGSGSSQSVNNWSRFRTPCIRILVTLTWLNTSFSTLYLLKGKPLWFFFVLVLVPHMQNFNTEYKWLRFSHWNLSIVLSTRFFSSHLWCDYYEHIRSGITDGSKIVLFFL